MSVADVSYVDFVNGTDESLMKYTIEYTAEGYTCLRGPRPSGAIIVAKMVHTTNSVLPIHGFVMPSPGTESCIDSGHCMMEAGHCVRCLHAEVSAIMAAVRTLPIVSLQGTTIFSINRPCYNCSLHIIAAGIKRICYAYTVYDDVRTSEALEAAGVECVHVPVD